MKENKGMKPINKDQNKQKQLFNPLTKSQM